MLKRHLSEPSRSLRFLLLWMAVSCLIGPILGIVLVHLGLPHTIVIMAVLLVSFGIIGWWLSEDTPAPDKDSSLGVLMERHNQ